MKSNPVKIVLVAVLASLLLAIVGVVYRAFTSPAHYIARGIEQRAHGNHDRAAGLFESARQLDPGAPEAYYQLARTHLETGRYGDCLAALHSLLQLDPAYLVDLRLQPFASVAADDPAFLQHYVAMAREKANLQDDTSIQPDASGGIYAAACYVRARLSYLDFLGASERAARAVVRQMGGEEGYRFSRDIMAGRLDDVVERTEALLSPGPGAIALQSLLQHAASARKSVAEHIELVASMDPQLAAVDLLAAQMHLERQMSTGAEAERRLRDVLLRFEPGIGSDDAKRSAASLYHSAAARSLLGDLYIEQGRLDVSAGEFEKLFELTGHERLSSHRGDVRIRLATAYARLQRYQDALAIVKLSGDPGVEVEAESRDPRVGFIRGMVELRQGGAYDEEACLRAARYFGRAASTFPDWFEAQLANGIARQRSGRSVEAAANFRRCMELRPLFAPAHTAMAASLFSQGFDKEAAGHASRALDIQPDNIYALELRVAANLMLSRFDAASADVEALGRIFAELARTDNGVDEARIPDFQQTGQRMMHIAVQLARPSGKETPAQLLQYCEELSRSGASSEWSITLAFCQMSAGRFGEACGTLELLEATAPDPSVSLALARIDLIEGEAAQAAQRLSLAGERWPGDTPLEAWALACRTLAGPANPALAKDAAAPAPGNGGISQESDWAFLAAAYLAAKADAPAEEAFIDLIRLDPIDPSLVNIVSMLYDPSAGRALPVTTAALQALYGRKPELAIMIRDRVSLHRASAGNRFRQLLLRRLGLWDGMINDL